ncbi:MAG: hypothetical protein ASARMPRED_007667 [Alectoria sarmentosa]|nr:MAG: hypothetical protein ASARMPRED_007667 [Alectoria sarmentosa]
MTDKAVARLAGINVGGPARITPSGDFGLIGLAVMGQNLLLNVADHKEFNVVAFNRTVTKVDRFMDNEAKDYKNIEGAHSIEEFVLKLKKPRRIMLLVMAGKPVDDFINSLLPFVEKGDIIIDGGNSHFPDTNRRTRSLAEKGIRFVGTGVSGGEEGARYGPSLMPGGNEEAWPYIKDIFQSIAAKSDGEPCCDWVGDEGAGHYVKMVHNGIEYGDMQLICEAYDIMKRGLGLSAKEMSDVFAEWNKGVLDSFLIEITRDVLRFDDDDGTPLVEKILDSAGQKGTGKWTAINALDLGMPVTLIGEAVFARCLSSLKQERGRAAGVLTGPTPKFEGDKKKFLSNLEQALYASKIISYAQGFMLIQNAAKEYKWKLNKPSIALMWRGGCIIRSVFLKDITSAYRKNPDLENLLFDDFFNKAIHKAQGGWRDIVSKGALWGIPTPAFSTALSWYDGYRTKDLPANLLQAQRDYFGAHTFKIKPDHANEKYPEAVQKDPSCQPGHPALDGWTPMDADKELETEEEGQAGRDQPTEQISRLSSSAKSLPISSIESQESAAGTDADADLLSSDMDRAGDGYRRRRAQLMDGLENGGPRRKISSKKHVRGHRNRSGAPDEENKQLVYSSDEGLGSDISSRTTSEDFELDHLTAEDPFSDDEETGMTKKDKRHRKRRRRKAIRMDERFAGNVKTPRPNKKFTYSEIYKAWLINALLVASWIFYFTRVGPCGAATGLDIGLGNMSLKFITLTFYTMCKSSSLAFVLAFAFLFRLEDPSIKLVVIITTMTIGVIMMVAGETAFDILGFILVILAAFFSGFRWALTQILLLKNPATSNPFSSIFFLAPVMFVSLAIIAIPVEGFVPLAHGLQTLLDTKGVFLGVCILLFPGCLAFMMTASEFALLQRTSVVTLSICGIFKEVVTIAAAGIVFKDPLTPINISGLLVTIASIGAYNYIKIAKMRKDARKDLAGGPKSTGDEDGDRSATEPMLSPPHGIRRDRLSADAPNNRVRAGSNAESVKSLGENE